MKVTLFGNRDFVDIIKYDYPYKTRRRDTGVGKMARRQILPLKPSEGA